jgi:hypothetical protein
LVDTTSTYHFEADYKNGEMFIDKTTANRAAFDAVINANEVLIGFGVGDVPHFYMTAKMDRFLKEASASIGLGALEAGGRYYVYRWADREQALPRVPGKATQITSSGR